MPTLVLYASILFTLACLFYSIGIWAEFIAKRLKPWHALAFFLGVLSDSTATALMGRYVGAMQLNAHTIIGMTGLALMVFHLFWAVIVLLRGDENARTRFHRFSVFVWGIWMIAYLSGVYVGMTNG